MSQKVINRWLVVVGAILIQLALGAIYAWSVFTPKLVANGWSKGDTQDIFAVGLVSFAVVMVLAGRLMPKIGPRMLAISGGVTLGLGYALAGLVGGTNYWALFILIGVLGGSGIGLAYVVPIAVGTRWFPDKKGLIMGLAVAGFGFGAMLWVKLAGSVGNLIASYGLSSTFLIYGIAFAAMVVVGGLFMIFPPEGYRPTGWQPPQIQDGAPATGVIDYTSWQMLKTPQFYLIFLCFVAGGGAGLMSIGLMKLFPMEALQANGMASAEASAVAGAAMAYFFSFANGIGRIAWGAMSDKLGRKLSIFIMLATQGIVVIAFPFMAGVESLLYIGAAIIGFNFGGNFALFPSITADTFGNKNVGQNYPWVFLAYGVGGIAGPKMGGMLGDLGNFPLAFTICGVAVLIASVCAVLVKPPKRVSQKSFGEDIVETATT